MCIVVVFMNYSAGIPIFPAVIKINFERNVNVDQEDIFNTMADVLDYPIILPENYISVKVINETDDIIYTEEEVAEAGIKTSMLVKHVIIPYQKHSIQVLNGYAQGTNITVLYEHENSDTKITVNGDIHVFGVLLPLALLTQNNIKHAFDTVLNDFVEYTRNNSTPIAPINNDIPNP